MLQATQARRHPLLIRTAVRPPSICLPRWLSRRTRVCPALQTMKPKATVGPARLLSAMRITSCRL